MCHRLEKLFPFGCWPYFGLLIGWKQLSIVYLWIKSNQFYKHLEALPSCSKSGKRFNFLDWSCWLFEEVHASQEMKEGRIPRKTRSKTSDWKQNITSRFLGFPISVTNNECTTNGIQQVAKRSIVFFVLTHSWYI